MTTSNTTPEASFKLSPAERRVFLGLMVGMLVASISQTIVGPAMPRIVAELGGMEHYSWVATAAMLVSAISVPIVGKLSDLYGRRSFYMGGLVVFMIGSMICGFTESFWVLVAGRAVQGLGMGTLMPLSQTIIGDIIPARQRGKYQGFMGAVFGLTSVAGPLAGGFITDHWGWRWLFFAALPFGVMALIIIARFLKIPHERRDATVDVWGIVTLVPAMVAILLATSWGGTTYPWDSVQIIGLFAVGVVLLGAFVFVELRASEPLLPLRLFRNPIFTFANLAAFGLAMVMFAAIIYIPVYAQGVLGVNATNSGLVLMPLMLGMVVVGIVAGLVITRTGRYKEIMVLGVLIMAGGVYLLTRLTAASSQTHLTIAMAVFGTGLGMAMQQYTLVVQNAVARRDLGVATASTQFFRNVGSTVGIAIFGSIMTGGLTQAIASHLDPKVVAQAGDKLDHLDAGAALDPSAMEGVPPQILLALRQGLADQLHLVFVGALPILLVVLLATLAIKPVPLRDTVTSTDDARRELLDTMGQSNADDRLVPGLGHADVGVRTRERILGAQLELLARESEKPHRVLLRRALADLGSGELQAGQALLSRTAAMLLADDPAVGAAEEKYAAALVRSAAVPGGILSEDVRQEIAVGLASHKDRDEVLSSFEPAVTDNHEAVDIASLRHAMNDLSTVLLVDLGRGTDDAEPHPRRAVAGEPGAAAPTGG